MIITYADAHAAVHSSVRFKSINVDDVNESAGALQDGRAHLAEVRPDVMMPTSGLTTVRGFLKGLAGKDGLMLITAV